MRERRFLEIDSMVTDWLHREYIRDHPEEADCDEFPFEPASFITDTEFLQRAAQEMGVSVEELEDWFKQDQAAIDEEDFINADLNQKEIEGWYSGDKDDNPE